MKYYLIPHNLRKYSFADVKQEIISTGNLEYDFINKDSKQMKKGDMCFISFSNSQISLSRILLLSEVVSNDNKILVLSNFKFLNKPSLNIKNLEKIKGKRIVNREKQEITDKLLNYILGEFKNYENYNENSFDSIIASIDPIEEVLNADIEDLKVEELNSRKVVKITTNYSGYSTEPRLKRYVIEKELYKCQLDKTHRSFITCNDRQYMEGHHIIPMSYQKMKEEINLDRTDNIICLCPNCHKEIHYGKNKRQLIKILYDMNKDNEIFKITKLSLNDLYKIYERKQEEKDDE